MQSSLTINHYQPNFQAKVAKHFINDAHTLFNYKHIGNNFKDKFEKKVLAFENFGYDDYYIKHIKKDINGKRFHQLIALRPGMDDSEGAVLTSKDQFRKVIEKFIYMNKYEFTKKMEAFNQRRFPQIRPEE